tara:strand:- start:2083 stop:2268 length:186 start_codon:yes stop_codon:yes gene_type:complete
MVQAVVTSEAHVEQSHYALAKGDPAACRLPRHVRAQFGCRCQVTLDVDAACYVTRPQAVDA